LTNAVVWSEIMTTENSTIIFPPVSVQGVSKQLKLVYSPGSITGVDTVDVYVNNSKVPCYKFWGALLNLSQSTLVFGWGEGHETCIATTINNNYVVDLTLSSQGNYVKFNIISPLIPDNCNNKTFSNSTADSAKILRVSCA